MKKSQRIIICLSGFICGTAAGDLLKIPYQAIILFMLFCLFFLLTKRYRIIFLSSFFVFLGILRSISAAPIIDQGHIAFYNQQTAVFYALLKQEPDQRQDHVKYTLDVRQIELGNKKTDVRGQVLVRADLYPKYNYGDFLKIRCRLKSPQPIENFRYDKYLARYNIYSVCYNARIEVLKNNQGLAAYAHLLQLKKAVTDKIDKALPEPQASFMAGILLGSRKGIPSDLMQAFNRTGVTHIIAVSGYNITIIAVLISNFLKTLGIGRKKAFWLSLTAIFCFVFLTGASAAVVRAALMGMLVLITRQVGRRSQATLITLFSAAIMLAINPKILLWDAGFQLSFLATIGLIYFSAPLEKYLNRVPSSFSLRENLSCTLSAIMMTTPLILYQFQRFSIVAPLVNLLILPVIPLAMLLGFLMILNSFAFDFGAEILSYFAWICLKYVIIIVEAFSSLEFASINLRISLWMMLGAYVIIFFYIRNINLKTKKKPICHKFQNPKFSAKQI